MRPRSRSGDESQTLVDGQEHNLRSGGDPPDFGRGRNSIHPRHIDIHQNDVRLQLDNFFNRLFSVLGVPTNLQTMPPQQLTKSCARRMMVVHDQYSCRQLGSFGLAVSGGSTHIPCSHLPARYPNPLGPGWPVNPLFREPVASRGTPLPNSLKSPTTFTCTGFTPGVK